MGESSFAHVLLLLALVLTLAKVGGEIATRLHQPPVLGELAAGILLGNLPWPALSDIKSDPAVDMLSQLGVLVLLFGVGLESTVADVVAVGAAAARVAVLGTIASFAFGFALSFAIAPSAGVGLHAFLGAAITATSIGITARVFKDLGKTRTPEARTILGAAVLDDIIGLVVLAVVSGILTSHTASPIGIAWTLAKTAGFLAVAVVVSMRVTPRLFRLAARLRTGGVLLAVGLSFCFFLSWAAHMMGLAPLVGAFAAGLVLEDAHSAHFVARGERSLSQLVEPLSEFLVPFFFVVMGLRADVRVLFQPDTLLLAGALTLAAIAGKLACGLGAKRGVDRLTVAIGMVPRGEVTLIFASLGVTLSSRVLDPRGYSALVAVVVLTTLVTPALLKWAFSRARVSA
jgi:Kef-type K+ transport system membrane component KefB